MPDMDGVSFLLVLSSAMFFGSYFAGQIPLLFTMSESRLRLVTIFGAGLLVGTALSVIVPEGVEALYQAQSELHHEHHLIPEAKSILEESGNGAPPGQQLRIIPPDAKLNERLDGNSDVVREKRESLPFFSSRKTLAEKSHANTAESGHGHHDEADHGKAEQSGHSHGHSHSHSHGNVHSSIGYSLVSGFVFMLLVDQIGSSAVARGERSGRIRMSISATIGLVVHAAADGVALGSASTINKSDVQLIVFLAIMLHKAPAAFGLVSFLLMEGLDKARVRRHLIVFSAAAPVAALFTFILLSYYGSDSIASSTSSTGILMLFSAGTFLYVSTVHVIPELAAHGSHPRDYTLVDAQAPATAGHAHSAGPTFTMGELGAIISGAVVPAILASGHSH